MTKEIEEKLKEFGANVGILIFSLAPVPDDWINQLKTYHKIVVTESNTAMMRFTITAMCVELFIARLEDLTTPKERATLESEMIEKITQMFELVDFSEQPDAKEKAKSIENMLMDLISLHRDMEVKDDLTIPQSYFVSFARSFKDIPEEYLTSYVEMKVKLFEDQNLRQKFVRELGR